MEGWQPLAPTKRSSGIYARANTGYGPAGSAGGRGSRFGAPSLPSTATEEEVAKDRRRWQLLEGPSDPFPPVGIFPRSVAVRILSNVTLADQRNCALAGRALAAAVADESNWKRRLDALDWCHVDGLTVKHIDGDKDEERHVGRRRKGKRKEEEGHGESTKEPEKSKKDARLDARPIVEKVNASSTANDENDDDFGDFAGPTKDAFADFTFDGKLPFSGGSSLASGKASLAMGGGTALNFTATGAPIFNTQPLIPVKLGSHTGLKATSGRSLAGSKMPFGGGSVFSYPAETGLSLCSSSPSFRKLKAYAAALKPFIVSLAETGAPASSSLLFTCDLGLSAQTSLLSNLLRFISTSVGGNASKTGGRSQRQHSIDGLEEESSLSTRSQDAARRLLSNLLSSCEGTLARRSDAIRAASHGADTARAIRRAEDDLRTHANGIWELGNARLALALSEGSDLAKADAEDQFGRMKAADLFLEHCPIISSGLKHNPLDNLSTRNDVAVLDFTAMDTFMADLIDVMKKDGDIVARIFPPEQDVLLTYADQVSQKVLGKYIQALLGHVKKVSAHLFLRSCAATFAQSLKMVDVIMQVEPHDAEIVTKERCEDVVHHLWEVNVDEYLQTESEWVRSEMQAVTERWESDVENDVSAARTDAAFLNSQNPAAVKRSVLSGFKDVLLLPVTVIPRTAGIVGGAVIRTAGTGLSTLNPLRWQSGGAATAKMGNSSNDQNFNKSLAVNGSSANLPRTPSGMNEKGYMDFSEGAIGTMDSDSDSEQGDGDVDHDATLDMNEHDEWDREVAVWSAVASSKPAEKEAKEAKRRSRAQQKAAHRTIGLTGPSNLSAPSPSRPGTAMSTASDTSKDRSSAPGGLSKMQMLLSLDTALQVIHVNRDCLKRIETFKGYPEPYGGRVTEAIREVSLLLFRALGEGHIAPGFDKAIKQIQEWKPEDHALEVGASNGKTTQQQQEVEPLVHFFELVHVGDTIAQMVQVYFDQEISRHIDKNDFLNPVVKGRKRFESNLDEAVARGLNAGVDLLLGQAEHIITTRQTAKDYNPTSGQLSDLNPTHACKEAVACLKLHCRMLVGSTDKNVLEVFYQEVGIRLHAIICKHLKRQVISLDGGFRVIADLNEYHTFVSSLRQPMLTADFSALKMLGNLYIIDNPKELAKLARDANMFGGTLSPEDLYEFLQARADFRSIEKAIDKEMYGFKASEDCCVA